MPTNTSQDSSGSDWRGGGSTPAQSRLPSQQTGNWIGWKKRQPREPRGPRRKLLAWALLCVALLVGFIAYLPYLPVCTPLVVVAAARYDVPLPPNAWVREDVTRLLNLKEIVAGPGGNQAWPDVLWESKERLREQLARVKPGGPNKDCAIIYLSMHGAVDGAGRPCLIPPGASPLKSQQWLPVRDLLASLFKPDQGSPAQPDGVKKLLILDCNRMDVNWSMGLLQNSFAEGVQNVVRELQVPNLYVLNSTSPRQIGWAAAELQGSVFAYYLWQGLSGAADDTDCGGNGDGKVSLRELHNYVAAQVRQWVTVNRADVQEPLLISAEREFPDFALVYVQKDRLADPVPPPTADPRWEDIDQLWVRHAELGANAPWRWNPLAWEELQHRLLQLELLLEAGDAYNGDEFQKVLKDAKNLTDALGKDPLRPRLTALNLPSARWLKKWTAQKRNDLLAAERASGGNAKPPPKPADAPRRYDYWVAAAAAWQQFGHLDRPTREGLQRALALVGKAESPPAVDTVELHFLRMLNQHLDPSVWATAGNQIKEAVAARHLAEQAASPADPQVHYAIRELAEKADQKRRSAEDNLFLGTADALKVSGPLWPQLSGEFETARSRAKELTKAFALRDRAYAIVPYLAQWRLRTTAP